MLHHFLSENRQNLIERCRNKVAKRASPEAAPGSPDHGIPFFLDQLIHTLRMDQIGQWPAAHKNPPPAEDPWTPDGKVGETAATHGGELMRRGFTVEQVVHDYGDLCQSITDLAFESRESLEVDEFRTLNRCLDNAIAMAVTEFNYQRDFQMADKQARAFNVQLGFFAHELRNYLNTAALALFAIKDGNLSLSGATGTVLDHTLVGMRNLIDRSLTDVRMSAGLPLRTGLFALSDFIGEIRLSAGLEAKMKECVLTIPPVDASLAVLGDRDLLLAAVGNLLQNAFKFTHCGTQVVLSAYAKGDLIVIDVEDHGDGLPPGEIEKMFEPFTQAGTDKSGLGLGLSISRRSVEANGGVLSVRNKPDAGCIFTITLPRHALPQASGPAAPAGPTGQ